ncbi:O-methyltransferase [Amphibacillus sediminis]|uniref:O-methyltransferase n=1 Tax=Amphibacillus sediminis TaxID=360185 RepID=UPI00082FC513|nr:O-methyltransferase [Amphibacillus sediminis]
MPDNIYDYLNKLRPSAPAWAYILEEEAVRDGIPIMEREGIDFIKQVIRLKQPKRALEIGSAIGYSALQMADASPDLSIITIERDQKRYQRAQVHLQDLDKNNQIELIFGDALDAIDIISQKGPYDLIFIDAAKGQYQRFFELYQPLLNSGGVIITDNVLFKGYVADSTGASKRLQALVKKIQRYNQWLSKHQLFDTIFLPIGDGIAVSTKKEKGVSFNETER